MKAKLKDLPSYLLILSISSISLNLACGEISFDSASDQLNGFSDESEQDEDALALSDSEDAHLSELSLSAAAKDKLRQVRTFLNELRDERNILCGIDESAHKAFADEVRLILQDEALDETVKREKIKELHLGRREDREAKKQALLECKASNGDQLDLIRSKADPVIAACLGEKHNGRHHIGRRGKHHGHKYVVKARMSLRDGNRLGDDKGFGVPDVASLEKMLLSEDCTKALATVAGASEGDQEVTDGEPAADNSVEEQSVAPEGSDE
jgi:hypothetical protein